MLVISRKFQQSVFVGYGENKIEFKIIDVSKYGVVSVGISAPSSMHIWRDDIKNREPRGFEHDEQ